MTEVFTGLPEQDILLTEFFLEKLLRRHTAPEFFYTNTTGDFFSVFVSGVVVAESRGEEKEIIGCNVVK